MTEQYLTVRLRLDLRMDGLHVEATTQSGQKTTGSSAWPENGFRIPTRLRSERKAIGRAIGAALLPGDVGELISRLAADMKTHLKIYLSADDDRLLEEPWESALVEVGGTTPIVIGRHLRITLLRFVHADRPVHGSGNRILIADCLATTDGGPLVLPDGTELAAVGPDDADKVATILTGLGSYTPERLAGPATARRLAGELDQVTYGFYFGGHYVTGKDQSGLVVAAPVTETSATAVVLSDREIAQQLAAARVEVAVFTVCNGAVSTEAGGRGSISLARTVAASGVRYVIAMQGPVAHSVSLDFASHFFAALAGGKTVEEAFAEGRYVLDGKDFVLPALYTCVRDAAVRTEPDPVAGSRPAVHPVRWLLTDWPTAGNAATGDRARTRLDVLCGLDRRPVTVVLADAPDGDPATDLNELEKAIEPALTELGLARRHWFTYDAGRHPLPEDRSQVGPRLTSGAGWDDRLLTSRDGAACGLVVRQEVPAGPDWAARLAEYARTRDRLFSGAALILHVVAVSEADALLGAVQVGRALNGTPWLAVVARGAYQARRVAEIDVAPPDLVISAIETDIGWARASRGLRGVPSRPEVALGDPVKVAIQAVENLNSRRERLADEAAFLRDLRLWLPEYFRQLLTRMAVARRGPDRPASLAVATDFDDDLHAWLAAGDDVLKGLDPARAMRPGWLGTDAVETIAWRLIAAGRYTDAEPWRRAVPSTAVARLMTLAQHDRGEAFAEQAATCLPATIGHLVRAGLLTPGRLDPVRPGLAYWALLTQTPVSAELVRDLAGLSTPERGPLGLHDPGESLDDPHAIDVGDPVRRVLRPVTRQG